MPKLVLAVALLVAVAAGCDSGDSHTTGTVEALPPGQLCLVPEDPEQTDLRGCFPLAETDRQKVRVGDCVALTVPADEGRWLRSIEKLSRRCRPPEPPAASTGAVRTAD
jgi:hypothetical protein